MTPVTQTTEHAVAGATAAPVLEIRGLRTHFFLRHGVVKAVDGVDLALHRNSTLALVGESGCGKSVTALSIMRLVKSPPGRIVDGQILYRRGAGDVVDLARLRPRGAHARRIRGAEISMIFQEPMTSLNPLYTVGSQVAEVVRVHQRLGRKAAMRQAIEMLADVQIPEPKRRAREYPHQLSGGMRQRVMIAMALCCRPSILIADEPTTALDVTVQAQILDLVRRLQDRFGTAILLITHNLGIVAQTADTVAVMYLGKIVECASVRDLYRRPRHPYTAALLRSVPVLGRKKDTLAGIAGTVPSPTETMPGCAFAPRCGRTRKICRQRAPELKEHKPGHKVACWLYGQE